MFEFVVMTIKVGAGIWSKSYFGTLAILMVSRILAGLRY